MKKFFAYLSLCVCVVAVGFAFSACSKKIESIALKDGIIKNEYFVGEQFDRTVGTIVVKQGNSYQEIPLTNTEIEILNFSTESETQKATAQITYKGVTLNFDYSVRLRTLQDFEVTGGSYTYDGSVRDVSISNLMEDVTVTKTYANLDKFGEPFVGAKNVGKYYINVTVSKQGFESVTKSAVIEIAPKEIEVRLTLPQNLTYDGTIKEVGAEIVSGLVEGDTCGVYIGGTETAKDAGEYSSYIVGSTNINYTISENTPQEENPIVWEILKADAIGVSAESVGFDSKQVPYDGTKHTIVATNALVLNAGSTMEENSTSIRYTYCQGDNCKVSSSGVTDAGVYTVYLTYKFKNYNDLVFSKTLTITPKEVEVVWQNYEGLTFTGSNLLVLAMVSAEDVVAGDQVNVEVEQENAINVGSYTATATLSNSNYTVSQNSKTLNYTISPKEIEVRLTLPQNLTYNKTEKQVTAQIVSGLVEGDTCNITILGTQKATTAGTYYCYVQIDGNNNYILSESSPSQQNPLEWTINKATIDISGLTLASVSVDHDGEEKFLTLEGELPDGITGVTITYNGSENKPKDVGVYEVCANFTVDEQNYITPASLTATLTINEVVTTITFDISEFAYSDSIGATFTVYVEDSFYTIYNDNEAYEVAYVTISANGTGSEVNAFSDADLKNPIPDFSYSVNESNVISSFVINGQTYTLAS